MLPSSDLFTVDSLPFLCNVRMGPVVALSMGTLLGCLIGLVSFVLFYGEGGEAGYEPVSSDNWAKLCNLNNTLSFAFNSKKSFSRFNKRKKKFLVILKKLGVVFTKCFTNYLR
jgi:hypothetical protein